MCERGGEAERGDLVVNETISKQYLYSLVQLISSLVTRDFEHIVRTCDIDNWKEALAVALTYAKADEFSDLCGKFDLWPVKKCEESQLEVWHMNSCFATKTLNISMDLNETFETELGRF